MSPGQANEIFRLWAEGRDTFEIAQTVGVPESQVDDMVYGWLVTKRERRSA